MGSLVLYIYDSLERIITFGTLNVIYDTFNRLIEKEDSDTEITQKYDGIINNDSQKAFKEVPEFRKKCDDTKVINEINGYLGRFNDTMLHSALFDFQENEFKYMICYNLPKNLKLPEKFTKLSVPKLTWVIFKAPNCEIQDLWKRIYSEWFPTSGYEQVKGPSFEMYYGMENQ